MTEKKKFWTISDYPPYLKFLRKKSVRLFKDRTEAFEYLDKDVFRTPLFDTHVRRTADKLGIPYHTCWITITNHLTNTLYEIDKAQARKTSISRFIFSAAFTLDCGHLITQLNKKFTLRPDISVLMKHEKQKNNE